MKKTIITVLALCVLLMTACTDGEKSESEHSTDSNETTVSTESLPMSESFIASEDMGRFDLPAPESSEEEVSVFVKEPGVVYGTAVDGTVDLSMQYTDADRVPLVGVTVRFSDGPSAYDYVTDAEGKIYFKDYPMYKTMGLYVIGLDGNGMFFGTFTVELAEHFDAIPSAKNMVFYADPYTNGFNASVKVKNEKLDMTTLSTVRVDAEEE